MSNRQARREQSRTARTTRTTQRSRPSRGPSRSSGGGSSIFSTGFLIALGVIAVVLVGLALAFTQFFGDDDAGGLSDKLATARDNIPADLAKGNKLGKDDAPVKVIEYEDIQCPFCLRYTANVEPELVEEFIKTGQMQIEYRHLPILGSESTLAALGMTCAGKQNKFWEFHNELFSVQAKAGQDTNEQIDAGRFTEGKLKSIASDLGLDRGQFDTCYQAPETVTEVSNNQKEAQSLGIRSTPGFIVNGGRIGEGSPSIEEWRNIVKQATEQKNASPTATGSATATGSPAATASASPTAGN
jgi:protein-disulfide isomerase